MTARPLGGWSLPAAPRRALQTWLALIRRPDAFFAAPPPDAAAPWPFALGVYALSFASGLAMQLFAIGHGPLVIALGAGAGLLLGLLSVPFWVLLGGLLLHGGLRLAGTARPLSETYRCLCYASAPLLLAHVPFIGLPLGLGWALCLGVLGVRRAHRTTPLRATLAAALPVALVLGLAAALGAALGTTQVTAGVASVGATARALVPGDRLLVLRVGAARGRPLMLLWSIDELGVLRPERLFRAL